LKKEIESHVVPLWIGYPGNSFIDGDLKNEAIFNNLICK